MFERLYDELRIAGDILQEYEAKRQELKDKMDEKVDEMRIMYSEVKDYDRKIEMVRDRMDSIRDELYDMSLMRSYRTPNSSRSLYTPSIFAFILS